MALLAIPLMLALGPRPYTHWYLLLVALALYAGAKVTELMDVHIFALTAEMLSGHSVKHLLAAGACYCLYRMIVIRRPVQTDQPVVEADGPPPLPAASD